MNVIFTAIFLIAVGIFIFNDPSGAIKAITDGGNKAVTLSIGLVAVYAVWSGFLQIAEDSGINGKISKLLSPAIGKLFKNADDETKKYISVNMSANLLGLGGIATPAGIEAMTRLGEKNDRDGTTLLFVIAATSIQLLPTTVISLRQNYSSADPTDIFLPSLLSTALSTAIGILLCFATRRRRKK